MLSNFVLAWIRWYQRMISPRKGFACAYRVVYGGSGCSGVGYRLIRRYGVFSGCLLLRKRLGYCRFAHELYSNKTNCYSKDFSYSQRGFCDVPDVVCDCDLTPTQKDCLFSTLDLTKCGCDAYSCGNEPAREPKKKAIRVPNLAGSD